MVKIVIYHDGVQEEVDEERVKIYDPFPPEESKEEE